MKNYSIYYDFADPKCSLYSHSSKLLIGNEVEFESRCTFTHEDDIKHKKQAKKPGFLYGQKHKAEFSENLQPERNFHF